jgi:hypothetical protein
MGIYVSAARIATSFSTPTNSYVPHLHALILQALGKRASIANLNIFQYFIFMVNLQLRIKTSQMKFSSFSHSSLENLDEPLKYWTLMQSPLLTSVQDIFLLIIFLLVEAQKLTPLQALSVPDVQNSTP